MITSHLPLGDVHFTGEYFSALVSEAAQSCFGVAGMAPRGMTDTMKGLVLGEQFNDKGVLVIEEDGSLSIELHITMSYGVNIATASKSITHRVRDVVELATGLKVTRVTVSVDDILA